MVRAVAISSWHRPFNAGADSFNPWVIIDITPGGLGNSADAKPSCNPLKRKYTAHLPLFKGIAVIRNYCNNRYNKADNNKYVYNLFFQLDTLHVAMAFSMAVLLHLLSREALYSSLIV